jgi:hypothetical protein
MLISKLKKQAIYIDDDSTRIGPFKSNLHKLFSIRYVPYARHYKPRIVYFLPHFFTAVYN